MAPLVRAALEEDVGGGDVTTDATVPAAGARATPSSARRRPVSSSALELVEATFSALDESVRFERLVEEGRWREEGPVIALEGPTRALLTGERTALNFLGHLSGIATMAARAVRALERLGGGDPRHAQDDPGPASAREGRGACGRGRSTTAAASTTPSSSRTTTSPPRAASRRRCEQARAAAPELAGTLEVEVRNAREIDEALAAGAPRLLLDNMDEAGLRAAVAQVRGRARLEASGGVTLEQLRGIGETGIDCISLGALTHSAPALDVSMILEPLS